MIMTGVLMLVLGGISAGSFYIPLKKVKGWSWESGWIAFGLFAWIAGPSASFVQEFCWCCSPSC
jgi:L-rhamnose-H+ transport protein